jgi:hypothetical protein
MIAMLLDYASAIDRRNHRLSTTYFAQDTEVNCRAFTAKGIDAFLDHMYRVMRDLSDLSDLSDIASHYQFRRCGLSWMKQ